MNELKSSFVFEVGRGLFLGALFGVGLEWGPSWLADDAERALMSLIGLEHIILLCCLLLVTTGLMVLAFGLPQSDSSYGWGGKVARLSIRSNVTFVGLSTGVYAGLTVAAAMAGLWKSVGIGVVGVVLLCLIAATHCWLWSVLIHAHPLPAWMDAFNKFKGRGLGLLMVFLGVVTLYVPPHTV